jgi:hypothetical protein
MRYIIDIGVWTFRSKTAWQILRIGHRSAAETTAGALSCDADLPAHRLRAAGGSGRFVSACSFVS